MCGFDLLASRRKQAVRSPVLGFVPEPRRDHDVRIGSCTHASAFLVESVRASAARAARRASVA